MICVCGHEDKREKYFPVERAAARRTHTTWEGLLCSRSGATLVTLFHTSSMLVVGGNSILDMLFMGERDHRTIEQVATPVTAADL